LQQLVSVLSHPKHHPVTTRTRSHAHYPSLHHPKLCHTHALSALLITCNVAFNYVAALQMLASSQAAAYRGCLGVLRHPCLSRLVALLALQGEASPLSARMLDLNGAATLIITSLDRQALSL
jgi:hypothetical protein